MWNKTNEIRAQLSMDFAKAMYGRDLTVFELHAHYVAVGRYYCGWSR